MKEILRRSDFVLKVSFYDISGKSTQVSRFKFRYSTALSEPIEAWFDGTTYSPNCSPVQDGVLIAFEKPLLNTGQLFVHREYTVKSDYFPDSQRDVTQVEPLNIQIVDTYTQQSYSPQATPITSSQQNIVLIETVVIETLTGEKGDPGMPSIDYSKTYEQVVEGEFFVGRNGQRKQVYTRTWLFESTFQQYAYGVYAEGFNATIGADTLLEVSGYVHEKNAGVTRSVSTVFYNILSNSASAYFTDITLWNNGKIVCNIVSVGAEKSQMVGETVQCSICVKYTKQ